MSVVVRKVLVTGGTGAVGPAVVRRLEAEGFELRVVTRTPQLVSAGADVVVGDLTDTRVQDKALIGVDAVVHLAAMLHHANVSVSMEPICREINVEVTKRLASMAAMRRIRFIFTSSIAVYGTSDSDPLTEETPGCPSTLYGRTKLEAETAVLAARDARGQASGVVLRLAAAYGPGIKGNYKRLIHALATRRFVPIGAGSNRRALVHVDDVAQAVVLVLRCATAEGRVYNVSDGMSHTLKDIIDSICRALARRSPRFALPVGAARAASSVLDSIAAAAGRRTMAGTHLAKYIEDVVISTSRIRGELGFEPRVTLDRGWQETIVALRASGEL